MQFIGLKLFFSVQVWYICIKLTDLSKKKSTFCLFKTEFKAKKLFARNLAMSFRRAVLILGRLLFNSKQCRQKTHFEKNWLEF